MLRDMDIMEDINDIRRVGEILSLTSNSVLPDIFARRKMFTKCLAIFNMILFKLSANFYYLKFSPMVQGRAGLEVSRAPRNHSKEAQSCTSYHA